MHDNYNLRQEQLNKASLLFSKTFLEDLLGMFNTHVVSKDFFNISVKALQSIFQD